MEHDGLGWVRVKRKGEGEGAGGGRWSWWNEVWIKIEEDGKWVGMGGDGLGSSTISHQSTVTESWRICRCWTSTEECKQLHLNKSWLCSCAVSLKNTKTALLTGECWFWEMIHIKPSQAFISVTNNRNLPLTYYLLTWLAFFIYMCATCCAALFVLLPFSTRPQIWVSEKHVRNNNKE